MDVNDPPDPARNAARLKEASKALSSSSYFTTDPAKTETLLDHLLSEPGGPPARLTLGAQSSLFPHRLRHGPWHGFALCV